MVRHPARTIARLLVVGVLILAGLLAVGTVEASRTATDGPPIGPTELLRQVFSEPSSAMATVGERITMASGALMARSWDALPWQANSPAIRPSTGIEVDQGGTLDL